MTRRKSSPDDAPRSPIPFQRLSNGEIAPAPPTPLERKLEAEVQLVAERVARRRALSRRDVLVGPVGTAIALSVVNLAACERKKDTYYDVPDSDSDALCDEDGLREQLDGSEFVLDVQTHHIDADPDAAWQQNAGWVAFLSYLGGQLGCESPDELECLSQTAYIDAVFRNSDTTVAVLTAVPEQQATQPLDNDHIAQTRDLVNELAGSERLVVHAGVLPNTEEGEAENLAAIVASMHPKAWKCYTQWGPDGTGWYLDDESVGVPFLDRVASTPDGPRIVCVHKGLPFTGMPIEYSSPRDVGPAAKLFPELQLVVYHSARDPDVEEGPYVEEGDDDGSSRLVRTLAAAGLSANGNVWCDLGSAWNMLISSPEQAAHLLGKMLLYLGEDRVLWGTDSIWYGTPQPFIEAFRTFSIPDELQELYGYPALTDEIKAKVLGLNAATLYGIDPDAIRCTLKGSLASLGPLPPRGLGPVGPAGYGPRSRREMLDGWLRKGRPG